MTTNPRDHIDPAQQREILRQAVQQVVPAQAGRRPASAFFAPGTETE